MRISLRQITAAAVATAAFIGATIALAQVTTNPAVTGVGVNLTSTTVTGTLPSNKGGTGIANAAASTITLGGPLITSGAFTTTLTATAATNSTLPAGTHSLAPLDSPAFTTPGIDAATGTSVIIGGAAGAGSPSPPVIGPGVFHAYGTEGTPGTGGAITFGTGPTALYAGIKGYFTNGANNTQGNIRFYTRRNATDASLTQSAEIDSAGGFNVAGTIAAATGGSANKAICWKSGTTLGYCSTVVAADGSCTCN